MELNYIDNWRNRHERGKNTLATLSRMKEPETKIVAFTNREDADKVVYDELPHFDLLFTC